METLFRELMWKGGQARIRLQTMQLPVKEGGMAVPHPRTYFLASQLQHMVGCGIQNSGNNGFRLILLRSPHKILIEALEADSLHYQCPTVKLINKVWQTTKALLGYTGVTEYAPLGHNENLTELKDIEIPKIWENQGITRVLHMYEGDLIKTFSKLRSEFNIPNKTFFKYLQVRHALQTQFKIHPMVRTHTPELLKMIQTNITKGQISVLYGKLGAKAISQTGVSKSRERWERDIGLLTSEQWNQILQRGTLVSITPAQRLSHLFLLHRVYYTPKKMFVLGWNANDECPRCKATGDFIHMFWRCPKLFRYWIEVINRINKIFKTSLEPEARTCLLGDAEEHRIPAGALESVLRCLFQARKLIAQRWQAHVPPTVENWVENINALIWCERVAFIKQGNYNRFRRVWEPWLTEMGISVER